MYRCDACSCEEKGMYVSDQSNEEFRKAMKSVSRKHGPYQQYNPDFQAKIGKDTSHHGVSAALCYFTRKLA